mmetsp:Transcript_10530/g.29614  ORF Transcript_10530/g.29614 Transcript_10530/m.29614 type:complete len:157 (+) Transcript_10530:125-595(+)
MELNCVASSRCGNDGRRGCLLAHPFCPLFRLLSGGTAPLNHLTLGWFHVSLLRTPNLVFLQGSVVFTISDNNEQWYLDLKSEKPSAGKLTAGGAPTNPDLSVKVSESDMIKMVRKELNPQQAFMKGKLKIKGKMALAMKLTSVLAATSKHLPKSRL